MNQVMKKGDVVAIIGYNSLLMSGLVLDEDCTPEEMTNTNVVVNIDNGWVISPSDCELVSKDTFVRLSEYGGSGRTKIERAAEKRGYYWKITLETKLPMRTVRAKGRARRQG